MSMPQPLHRVAVHSPGDLVAWFTCPGPIIPRPRLSLGTPVQCLAPAESPSCGPAAKSAPPQPKSFLEKTLTRATRPSRAATYLRGRSLGLCPRHAPAGALLLARAGPLRVRANGPANIPLATLLAVLTLVPISTRAPDARSWPDALGLLRAWPTRWKLGLMPAFNSASRLRERSSRQANPHRIRTSTRRCRSA